ncbi:P-loop containing nucleoside triphosphate hydrolase protein [Gymnopilus junonius]|uniref:P-loop containing nucleoside triphosphate hydrolase protein n=1 Tax=Gymnopilus junonius TaxID=109634 RepID=A0A9P5TJ16_GYMJU|nr:P-loop containing nucleoside triphosphate hydrolase protein [Gymnopilus junonius]
MPSHFVHGALVDMYLEGDGAPWIFPQWQEITGIYAGIFTEPSPEFPAPSNWTDQQRRQVKSYFDQYAKKPDATAKIKFSGAPASQVPGAELWRRFINNGWKSWKIHDRITRVLIETRFHPCILAKYSANPDAWPDSTDIIPQILDDVALELFGEDSLDGLGRLQDSLRPSTKALVQRTWISIHNKVTATKKKIAMHEKEAVDAFDKIERQKHATKESIKDAIAKISRWKTSCEVIHSSTSNAKIADMEGKLGQLMSVLSGDLPAASARVSKATVKSLSDLSSKDDIEDVVLMYRDFTNTTPLEDSISLEAQQPTLRVTFGERSELSDPGVEEECRMRPEQLAQNLGFKNGLPLLFNRFRHRDGLSPWDPAYTSLFEEKKARKDPNMTLFSLHWHQLAGVHSIIRNAFASKANPKNCPGVLIADDVGLGKTCQSVAVIAFLADAVHRQKQKLGQAPLLVKKPFLGESNTIPDLPILIIVPGTVQAQWASEFRLTVNPKAFDVMVYGTGIQSHKEFWAKDGPFRRSNQPLSSRVIIASHSALTQDFHLLYAQVEKKKAKEKMPWEARQQLPGFKENVQSNLFGQKYLTVVLDEAHEFRNTGPKHTAAFAILQKACLRLVMTATPLQTSTKDIGAMGRLVGIPYFMTDQAQKMDKDDIAEIRRVRKDLDSDYDPLNNDPNDPVKKVYAKIARGKQVHFLDHILRRTVDSLDYEGQHLIKIPPYRTIMVTLQLEEREVEILEQLDSRVKETVSNSNSILGIASGNFYLEYRMGVCFPRSDPKDPIPKFKTLQEWKAAKSTKFDTCAKLVKHLLSRDDAPEIKVQDGKVKFPRLSSAEEAKPVTQKRKVLIFQEFPSLGPLLRNVLDLYGIKYVYIDGDNSLDERAKRVGIFRADPTVRLLVFTKVGMTGLNLANADAMIFLDQPWSGQEMQQARGRAHRQPQKNVVRCYHLLADNTADIILYGLARGKQDMMGAFLTKKKGNGKTLNNFLFKLVSDAYLGRNVHAFHGSFDF